MSSRIHLDLADILLILLYGTGVVVVGFLVARRKGGALDDYLLAGRTLTLPIFVATLVSTWYGGILGVGEFSYRYGISNWLVLGVPYYIFALLFALLIAKRVRATNYVTIPDKLEASYDRRTAIVGALLTFVLTTPAPYVLMLGVLVQLIFGFNLEISVVASTVITLLYLVKGGFRSAVWANVLQFVLMFAGFAMMLPFAISRLGGWNFLKANLPSHHLTWHGGNSPQYVLVWFFIALWTLVDPSFHQRCYAARDGKTAQRGIFISILFWFIFDALTTTAGLYARAALPELERPLFAYPMLAELLLPPLAKGIFYVGMLATIMSTLSSLAFISATTIGKDIVARLQNDSASAQRWTQIGVGITALVSIGLALLIPSVVNLWYTIGTCIIPGLLVPLMAGYFDALRISARGALTAMTAGWGTSTASLLWGLSMSHGENPSYWFGVEPMYPGLAISLIVWAVERIRTTKTSKK
jgi:SSS family solute:Na+ symporter